MMHKQTNRLISEKSPYLQQHAHNPVQWYPWGEEAFAAAEREDKPIFLSIGYATCHWCHVMERESFEEEEIAALMNRAFICIKVDREERPDLDAIYMRVCQVMTGQGGWPLTILMTPEKRPFYAATYIPPAGRYGRMGMDQLVPRVETAWTTRRAEVLQSAADILNHCSSITPSFKEEEAEELSRCVETGYQALMQEYDGIRGGFGRAPKFPTPHKLIYLLRSGQAEGQQAALDTLKAICLGGIYDHIGYGIHRYSTDERWLVPHFEKMLYDQAMLVLALVEAYEVSHDAYFALKVREILGYVARDMQDAQGGFYAAEDADSEGEEGLFYLWKAAELREVLGAEEAEWFMARYQVQEEGNYLDEARQVKNGRNILHQIAALDADELARFSQIRDQLFAWREKRIHPLKDRKVLTDWNGLMISAFARAGLVLSDESYLERAEQAFGFIRRTMIRADGSCWHRWFDGEVRVEGMLDDYAFLIQACLDLYEATHEVDYLKQSIQLQRRLDAAFRDEESWGYWMTAIDGEALIVRPKELYDGAIPSGNSVAVLNLLRLGRLTGEAAYEQQADRMVTGYSGMIRQSPAGFIQALIGFQQALQAGLELVLVGEPEDMDALEMEQLIRMTRTSRRSMLWKHAANQDQLAELAPFTKAMASSGRATVYLCRGQACEQPIFTVEALQERLAESI
jgi:uncharacterized protein